MQAPYKNKKVLVLNIGLLGGGITTTNWFVEQGAKVTVTDFADAKVMAPAVKRVEDHLKKVAPDGESYEKLHARLAWSLGKHSNALVDACDVLVVNPSVSINHPYVKRALNAKKDVVNEGTLFYNNWKKKTVGVTGTRGKTTTANWTAHLIKGSVLTGNSIVKPFQAVMGARNPVAVTELSSFILELFPLIKRAPTVAVITNLYRDHLNRHGTMQEYAQAKANIFQQQSASDALILNADNEWTPWFVSQKPPSRVFYTSMHTLGAGLQGVWFSENTVFERAASRDREVLDLSGFRETWGRHNVENILQAIMAARLVGIPYKQIQQRVASLPTVAYRQEVVHRDARVTVVNDTTATSPEAGIAALERWGGPTCVLICGGTDRELDYRQWARDVPKYVRRTNTIFLMGSATQKMRAALGAHGRGIRAYDTLEKAVKAARVRAGQYISSVVLFSPAAKSFELFANEYDRGQQFNALVKDTFKGR